MMSFIALVAMAVFILVNHFDAKIILLIVTLMMYRVLDAISDVLYGVLQVHDRLFQAGKSNFIKSAISLVGFMVVDYLTNDLVLASSVFIVVFILGIVLFDIRNINIIQPISRHALRSEGIRSMAIRLLPFALIMFLPTVLNNISKYFIEIWHPNDQGYFTILILPLFFLTLVISFVISPFLTRLAYMLHEGQSANFRKTINKISILTLLTGVILLPITYLVAPFVLQLVFGISFWQYDIQLMLIVASGIFYTLATIYSSMLIILREIHVQLLLLMILLFINIILSVILISPFSIDGAIMVSMITNAVWLLAFWSVYNIRINKMEEVER